MKIPLYQIDAFTKTLFAGNPAAVCPLQDWLYDKTLQAIAAENNLSETAFFVPQGDHYDLRWFTPKVEIDLCGHATLASAHVVFHFIDPSACAVRFQTRSGLLAVEREGDLLAMQFPSRPGNPVGCPDSLIQGLGSEPDEVLFSRDFLAVFSSEETVKSIQPDMSRLMELDGLGVIVTSAGHQCDFVSRFFAPKAGVPEDPVTGSAHCTLIPYWAGRLGKKELHALQVSQRGGELFCTDLSDVVKIAGHAVTYLKGSITL
jgi:predicted PhzF superfamily epimerase YddE/YHI9